MKKLFTLALLTSLTYAVTDTATLNLRGVVGSIVDVSVAAESDAQSLDLSTSTSNKKVATVSETTNTTGNYTLAVSSANGGNLKHSNGDNFPYSMTYGGQGVNLATGTTYTRTSTPLTTQNFDVKISYTGVNAASMVAGNYDDLVTFTITAN